MKLRRTVLLPIWFLFAFLLAGCSTTPNVQEINEIPANAIEITTSELRVQSGTYTEGSIYVSGNGYIVLDVQLESGSVKTIGIKDVVEDEIICTISKPKTALYDSAMYEYRADSEYKLSFTDAKDITGTITVYFVAE